MDNETWQFAGSEAWLSLSDCRLVVLKNMLEPDYGWRWVVIPYTQTGNLSIKEAIQSVDANSEVEPYPTQEGAISAVQNFYQRLKAVTEA